LAAVNVEAVDLAAVDVEAVNPQVVDVELVDLDSVDLKAVDQVGGTMGAETLFIGLLIIVGIDRIEYNCVCQRMRDATGWECETVNLGMMQYLTYAALGVNS
jgi:hypothetical protein